MIDTLPTQIEQWLNLPLLTIGETVLRGANLLSALALLLGSWWLARTVSRATHRAGQVSRLNLSNLYILSRLLRYLIFGAGLLAALGALGVSFAKLAIVAGALGVGIGFGLQTIVNNFVCGIIILFEKSLRVGDFIELPNGLLGEVREINIRSTLIRTLDNADILVPNADFVSQQVNNWTLNDNVRRFSIPFSVAYGSDLAQVEQVVLEAAKQLPSTLQRSPFLPAVLVTALADSGVEALLSVWAEGDWVKRPGQVRSNYTVAIYNALRAAQITIPFPQLDLHLPGKSDAESV